MRSPLTRRDLTVGPLAANIWHLALPLMVSGALQDLFNIVDMIFVGRLGPGAIAGVSMGGVVMGLIRMLAMGISTGTVAPSRRRRSRSVTTVSPASTRS